MFDPDAFLSQTITTAMDTSIIPCPMGEYQGVITKLKPRQFPGKNGGDTVTMLDVYCEVDLDLFPEVREATQRDKVTVRGSVFIDVTSQGALEKGPGKNVALGRLREAVGQNDDGEDWSPGQLIGSVVAFKVSHRKDEKNPDVLYDQIDTFGSVS